MGDVANFPARLEAVRAELAGLGEQERLARRMRDELAVEAIDAGHTWAQVTEWAGISQGHLHRVLAARVAS
ncbi:MAG: hypothetical protein ACJ72N_22020 [Labedaea sp.]